MNCTLQQLVGYVINVYIFTLVCVSVHMNGQYTMREGGGNHHECEMRWGQKDNLSQA